MSDSGSGDASAAPMPSTGELIKRSRMDFAGALITTLGYGIYLVIAFASLKLLLSRKGSSTGRTVTIAYTLGMLIITSVAFGTSTRSNTILLVDSVYRPEMLENLYCSPTNIVTGVLSTLQIYGSDALLLYRTFVILEGNWWLMILPGLTYLAIFGIGITGNLFCASKDLGGSLNIPVVTDLATPLYSLTVGLNILTTLLIGVKLLRYRSRVFRAGVRGHDALRELTSVIGILVESAALYSLTGIIYIAFYARGHPLASPLSNLFGAMTFISPALIILRVALGVAYKRGSSRGTGGTSDALHTAESGQPRSSRASHATGAQSFTGSSMASPYGYEKQETSVLSATTGNTYEMVNVPLAPNRRPEHS